MRRLLTSAAAAAFMAACGGGPPSPPGMAYDLPEPATLTYVQGDTANMDIDAGGQSMQARVSTSATLGVSFTRAPEGLQVSITVEDFSGRLTQPMGGPVTADESGVEGPITFLLDRRGMVTAVERPRLSGTAEQFVDPLSMAHSFFPRVPGRAVGMGATWTDTIAYSGPSAAGEVSATTVMAYTVAGDTTVAGRAVMRVTMEGSTDTQSSGVIAGMDFRQSAAGDVSGWFHWDMQRGVMTESYSETDLRGTMEVPAAPFPLDIRLRNQSRTRLQGGM